MSRKLQEYALKQAEGLPLRLDDIAGKSVVVQSVRWAVGNFGEYVIMTLENVEGEVQDVMTSAMLVLDALHNAEGAKAFPAEVTFVKHGRTWICS